MTDTAGVPTLPSSLLSRFKMFGAAQPVWSVLQSDCRGGPARKVFSEGHINYVIKLSKAYNASSNVLREIVKLT